MEFSYTSTEPTINATMMVIWGGSKPLDNPDNIHLELYKCPEMATNCGRCLNLRDPYKCGWCKVCHLLFTLSRIASSKSTSCYFGRLFIHSFAGFILIWKYWETFFLQETKRCELSEYGMHECYKYEYAYNSKSNRQSIKSRSSAFADHHGEC